jgi:hypothetical protein
MAIQPEDVRSVSFHQSALADRLRTFCGKKAIPLASIWAAISNY